MSVAERIRRAEVLFNWSRDYLARSIVAARGPMSDDDLKWEIALRQYGTHPATIRVGYVYDAVYKTPAISARTFGLQSEGVFIEGSESREELTLWQEWQNIMT